MRLRIFLDAKYMEIVARAALAIADSLPGAAVSARRRKGVRMYIVSASSVQWDLLFPQHGPGPKHERDVSLLPWQSRITTRHPERFIRGLIHSDGSRFIANQVSLGHAYQYARYCFGNKSADIIEEFCRHLDLLDIAWTMPRSDVVQVARKEAVAALDQFVGPKR